MKKGIKKSLSLVIPAHNAEKVIENSVIIYNEIFSKNLNDFEMIVICNDCWDNTYNICKSLETRYPLKTIEIPQRGKGYALVRGFSEAQYDIFGFLDADNPFDLNKILEMLEHLENCDAVIVSKYLKRKSKKQEEIMRRFISLGGSFFSNIFLGLNFRDTQAGAKFFTKDVWELISNNNNNNNKINPQYGFTCLGFDWDMEFLYKLKKLNLRIAEVYIPATAMKFSTFRIKYLPGMVKRLLILRFLKKFP